jgi:hypothetical protein
VIAELLPAIIQYFTDVRWVFSSRPQLVACSWVTLSKAQAYLWAHSCRPVMRSAKIVSFDRFCRVFPKLFPLSKPKISTTVTPSPSAKAVPALEMYPFNVAAMSKQSLDSPRPLLPVIGRLTSYCHFLFSLAFESVMSFTNARQSFVLPFEPDTSS